MKYIETHSLGGTCDRCGKGIKNVAVFENDNERMSVGLDCAMLITASDFKSQRKIKDEIKAARNLTAFNKAVKTGEAQMNTAHTLDNVAPLWWSDSKGSHYAGWANDKLTGIMAQYRDAVLNFALNDTKGRPA